MNIIAPVGILGFGVEGMSTLRYLIRNGVKEIVVMDKNSIALPEVPKGISIKVFSGENYLDGLKDTVTLVRSAGVYPMSQELFKFQMNGGIITSQIQLFLEQTQSKHVIGVTGTLGKGSTVSMIAHILSAQKIPNKIGGNFGIAALDLLEDESPDRVTILELSSFQLMTLAQSPEIAVVLRVSTDHLDWHKSVEEYRDAKANLVRYQKRKNTCIYFKDALPSEKIATESPAKNRRTISYAQGDALIENASLTIEGFNLSLAETPVKGLYQLENMAAATLATHAIGVAISDAFNALKSYNTLPYRMEFKGEKKGIEFYNDSYSTRPDACIAATASMQRPFALILGGSEKNADFKELAKVLSQKRPRLQKIALIGETADRLLEELQAAGISVECKKCDDLKSAFDYAVQIQKGAVLMSPACASFGLFKNYKARGEAFNQLVNAFE